MKRQAESQKTRETEDQEDNDSETQGEGFKIADEATLATRKIRALPKRGAGPPASPTPSNPFAPTTMATDAPSSKFAPFTGFSSFNGSAPTASPLQSPSNSFNSASTLVGSQGSFSGAITGPSAPSNTAKSVFAMLESPKETKNSDDSVVSYYVSLRGLNESFVTHVSKAVADDPFTDASILLQRYQDLRKDIQTKFDSSSASSSMVSTPKQIVDPPKALSMPAPPSAFSFGGKQTAPQSTSFSNTGGFTPTVNGTSSTASPFSFPSSAPSQTPTASPEMKTGETTPAPSPFATSTNASPSANPFAAATGSPFKFGGSDSGVSALGSPFGTPTKPSLSTSAFAAAAKSEFFPSVPSTSAPPPKAPAAFGGFGGFGTNVSAASFSFGDSTPTHEEKKEEAQVSQDSEGDENKTGFSISSSNHDEEGEGEENEETLHSTRVKVYRLKKNAEGAQAWADMGVGMLRVKRDKGTEARRLLLRNTSTGKIIINFNIYAGLQPTLTKKAISLVGHDEGKPASFSVRSKTDEQAAELQNVLNREIAFVKAKQEA